MQATNVKIDKDALIKILKSKKVRMSKKGYVCLGDLVTNIIKSTNSSLYRKRLGNAYEIHTEAKIDYVRQSDCVKILQKCKFKQCKEICTKIQIIDDNGETLIDAKNEIFQFEGQRFMSAFVEKDDGEWDVWVKGCEISKFLLYKDETQAICDHVQNKNKLSFFKLCEKFKTVKKTLSKNTLSLEGQAGVKSVISAPAKKNTIFINLQGIFNLIHGSKKPLAAKIKDWLDNEVLPALVKYGTYTMQSKIEIECIYDKVSFSKYDSLAVMYIGYIGCIDGEHMFKYGLSRDMFQREYKNHRNFFTVFKLVHIIKCDNCEVVEKLLKKDLKVLELYRKAVINGKNQTELFTVSTKYPYTHFIDLLNDIVANNKLPEIKEADNKIKNLSAVNNVYQQQEKHQHDIIMFKLSENYKLEMEHQYRMKQIDLEIQKEKIVEQKEKNKQIAMDRGYNLKDLGYNNDIVIV